MNGWIEKPLSEIADITMGQSPDSKYYTEDEQGMSFIQGCAEFTSRYPMPKINCTQIKKVAKAGSILFSVRAPVGRINVADRDYVIGRGLASILAKDIAPGLLEKCLVFREPQFRVASQGSTFEAINSKELSGWPISFPMDPLEQQKIAELLGQLDRAIEQTEALIAKQQRIKTGLMQGLLTKGIDAHGNIRSEATHAFKDPPLGRIPVEWDAISVDDLACHVGSGVTPRGGEAVYSHEGVLFIRSQNVHFGGLRLDDVAYISDSIHRAMRRSEVYENDVLLNITGASIGRCCRMPRIDGQANVNQHVCAIRLTDGNNAKASFLCEILESDIGQLQIAQFNAGGNREGLNYQQVRSFLVPWPKDQDEFDRVADCVDRTAKHRITVQFSLEKLKDLKDGLMHDLITGERRVTALLAQAATQ